MNSTKKSKGRSPHQNQRQYITDEVIKARLKKGPASRKELARLINRSDRVLRAHIARLQTTDKGLGRLIINLQDGSGYKLAGSRKELVEYRSQEIARANQILKKLNNQTWEEDTQIELVQ